MEKGIREYFEKLDSKLDEITNIKDLDAIWSVYLRNRDCRYIKPSLTCKEYGLGLDSRASVIISIIEDYYKNN